MRGTAVQVSETIRANLEDAERALLERFQRGVPLLQRPFAAMAQAMESSEGQVLECLKGLQERGIVTRVGPVFRPNTVGASTLAAMAVPEQRLAQVAERVNAFPEVNHNYQRDHRFNLWFVVTAAQRSEVLRVLERIRIATQLEVLDLPLLTPYHIDLGFSICAGSGSAAPSPRTSAASCALAAGTDKLSLSGEERRLVAAVQRGLPLIPKPYDAVARGARLEEDKVRRVLEKWLGQGVVRRIGIVVRHHELGFSANAMVVWNAPDGQVDELGQRLAAFDFVTLCYRRPRREPYWPYNLFCMIHGRDRPSVLAQVERLADASRLGRYRHQVLFSLRRFKQRGALYQNEQQALAHG